MSASIQANFTRSYKETLISRDRAEGTVGGIKTHKRNEITSSASRFHKRTEAQPSPLTARSRNFH